MKPLHTIIALIIGVASGILFIKSCSSDLQPTVDNLQEKLKVEREARNKANYHIVELNKMLDSLKNARDRTETQMVYREREIDESIFKDSTNALVQYRQSLTENNWLPESTPQLTLREIGIGSKLMAKVPKLELQINLQDSMIFTYEKIKADDNFIKKSYQSSLEIKDLEINKYATALKKEQAWYNSNWLWFAGGVVAAVATVFLAGLAK